MKTYIVYWCLIYNNPIACNGSNVVDEFNRQSYTTTLAFCYEIKKQCNNSKQFVSYKDANEFYERAKLEPMIEDVKLDSIIAK